MKDVGHNMLHLNVARHLPSLSSSCTSELSPTKDKDAELNRQFPFDIDLNKILPDLLKSRAKAQKLDIHFLQHT